MPHRVIVPHLKFENEVILPVFVFGTQDAPKATTFKRQTFKLSGTRSHSMTELRKKLKIHDSVPTPKQIQQRSARIRRRWSLQTEKRRKVGRTASWNIPWIPFSDLDFPSNQLP